VKMFNAGKTRMIGLPYGVKTVTICWAVFIWYRNIMDRRTDLLYQYRASAYWRVNWRVIKS